MSQTGALREVCFVSYVTSWIYAISFCICGFFWSTMASVCFRKVGAHGPSDSWVKFQCCLKKKKDHVCLSENRGYTIRIYERVLHEYHIQWGYLYWLIFKTLHPCSSGKLGFTPLEYRVFSLQFSDQPICQKGPQKPRSRLQRLWRSSAADASPHHGGGWRSVGACSKTLLHRWIVVDNGKYWLIMGNSWVFLFPQTCVYLEKHEFIVMFNVHLQYILQKNTW